MLISEFRGADMCQFVNLSQIRISQEQNCWNDLNYLRFVKQVLQTSTWNHLTTLTGAFLRSSAALKISPLCQISWRAQRGFYERLVVTIHASAAVLKSMCELSLAKFSDNREKLHPAGITGRKNINSCQVCVYVKVFFTRISLLC